MFGFDRDGAAIFAFWLTTPRNGEGREGERYIYEGCSWQKASDTTRIMKVDR